MILSILTLDVRSPSVRQALRNCQDMHRNLLGAFDQDRSGVDLLYFLDKRIDTIHLYTLSAEQPDWSMIAANGYTCLGMKDVSALKDVCREGKRIRFNLFACPSKKVKTERGNSKRVFLRDEEQRTAWMHRQAKKYGFSVLALREMGVQQVTGRKGKDQIAYTGVRFTGVLCIEDADLFWQSYTEGFGPGKAYGLGLMLISAV